MDTDERQFLKTVAWMFMRHGQRLRALAVCEALSEDDPRDGTVAVALAELLLGEGNAARALTVLHEADVPSTLAHAEAVLETRALKMLGRRSEAASRWNRYLESRKGSARQWL
jgi:hypothetical protein